MSMAPGERRSHYVALISWKTDDAAINGGLQWWSNGATEKGKRSRAGRTGRAVWRRDDVGQAMRRGSQEAGPTAGGDVLHN